MEIDRDWRIWFTTTAKQIYTLDHWQGQNIERFVRTLFIVSSDKLKQCAHFWRRRLGQQALDQLLLAVQWGGLDYAHGEIL